MYAGEAYVSVEGVCGDDVGEVVAVEGLSDVCFDSVW